METLLIDQIKDDAIDVEIQHDGPFVSVDESSTMRLEQPEVDIIVSVLVDCPANNCASSTVLKSKMLIYLIEEDVTPDLE